MNKLLSIAATLVLMLASAPGAEPEWKKYANARFGFVLTYPNTLIAGAEAMNGGGREFHSADGEFSLATSAHFFVPDSGDSFEKRWQEELDTPNVTISYKKKTPAWYVVSGVTKDGTEYYHKLYRKGSNWAAFHITYPHAKNKKYDAWVTRIEKSFVPFREGDFDRLE
jgi:hypothetical protein